MQVDIEKYTEGRRAFDEGLALLTVYEKLLAAGNDQKAEAGALSFCVGFFDAALDRLRGITT